jgi:hypothetical protein
VVQVELLGVGLFHRTFVLLLRVVWLMLMAVIHATDTLLQVAVRLGQHQQVQADFLAAVVQAVQEVHLLVVVVAQQIIGEFQVEAVLVEAVEAIAVLLHQVVMAFQVAAAVVHILVVQPL